MQVLMHRIPGHPLAGAEVVVKVGWRHEPEPILGISHFTEHVLFRGSRRYLDPDETAGKYGVSFDGFCNPEATGFNFVSLRADFFALLDVLLDLVFHPRLEDEAVEAERPIVRGAIGSEEDYLPWELVQIWADNLAFSMDGLRNLGKSETIDAISASDIRAWHRRFYHQRNFVLIVAGDVEEKEVHKALESLEMPGLGEQPVPRPVRYPGHVWVEKRDIPNTEMFLAFRFSRDVDYSVLFTLATLLANEPQSLLCQALRTKEPLAYMVDDDVRVLSDAGRFGIYVGVAELGKEQQVWERILTLIDDLRAGKIPEEKLIWAEKVMQLEFLGDLSDPERALRWNRKKVLWGVEAEPKAVGAERVQKLAQKLFQKENAYFAVCGPTDWDPEEAFAALP